MDEHEVIIYDIRDIFIDMNKVIVTENSIINACDKRK